MCYIIGCDHSLDLKVFLDQLNLLCSDMFIFAIDQLLWAHELMDRIMGCDHSLGRKDIHLNSFIISWSYFLLQYIFLNIFYC
jgi:hypothetical protein